MADGSLLIEVCNEKQSETASNLIKLNEFEVSSMAHKTLNVVKGVITCRDLQYCSDEEILENLKEQGVIEIFRIPQRKDLTKPSCTFILTFKLHQLPARIHAGWYAIRVRSYIPSPMRCFTCQKFGHTATKCALRPVCPSCGHDIHPEEQCNKSPKCVNCGEVHPPDIRVVLNINRNLKYKKLKPLKNSITSRPNGNSSLNIQHCQPYSAMLLKTRDPGW